MGDGFISRSSGNETDPLSDILSLLKPFAYKSVGLDAGGEWALCLGPTDGFLCLAPLSGVCWLVVDGSEDRVLLQAGEFAVLPKAPAFRIASDPTLAAVDITSASIDWPRGGFVTWQGGGTCLLLSAFFTFASEHSNLLLEVLPPILHLGEAFDRASLKWCLERLMAVISNPQPGSVLQGEYLAQMMLLEILRLHATGNLTHQVGWLSALASRQLGAAIRAMHKHPGHRWTVQELADHAAMSRSVFAQHFKAKVGVAVMEYLIRWRMLVAADRLVHSPDTIAAISLSLGYESESVFGFAFKREMGCSPRQYVKQRTLGTNHL